MKKAAPKKVPNRSLKVKHLLVMQGYECPIAKNFGEWATPEEIHHAGVHNTEVNRRLYPLLIHSLWNLLLVNHQFHMKHGSFGRMSEKEAASREAFLERHPCIAKKLNMEV